MSYDYITYFSKLNYSKLISSSDDCSLNIYKKYSYEI